MCFAVTSDEFELSRAELKSFRSELGTSIFELKPSWIFFIHRFFNSKLFLSWTNISYFERKKYHLPWKIPKIEWKCRGNAKNAYFLIFELKFFLRAERKRSRAEPKILLLELWLEPARLELITSGYIIIFVSQLLLSHLCNLTKGLGALIIIC